MTIRIGLAGLGKMGLSHLAIVNAHPQLEVAAVCDGLSYLTNNLKKFTSFNCYNDYQEMLEKEQLDAVLIATPSKAHAAMATQAIQAGLHVFCEKPFVLDITEGQKIIDRAAAGDLVTQVGYHNRFVGAFQKAQQLVAEGALGTVYHFRAEAYAHVICRLLLIAHNYLGHILPDYHFILELLTGPEFQRQLEFFAIARVLGHAQGS